MKKFLFFIAFVFLFISGTLFTVRQLGLSDKVAESNSSRATEVALEKTVSALQPTPTQEWVPPHTTMVVGENIVKVGIETDPNLIGSYCFTRSNLGQRWTECGSWQGDIELFLDQNKKICFGYYQSGTVRASRGYGWVKTRKGGRECLVLQKTK